MHEFIMARGFMNDNMTGKEYEFHTTMHLIMLVAMTLVSLMILVLTFVIGLDIWMVPVVCVGTVIGWAMRFSGSVPRIVQVYFCALFLMLQCFYISANEGSIHDSGAILVVLVIMLAFTGEKILLIGGVISGYAGVLLNLYIQSKQSGSTPGRSEVIGIIWQFVIIVFAAFFVYRISEAWKNTEKEFLSEIDMVEEENARVNNFLANVSHEIRTPINVVMGLSSVLEQEKLPDYVRERVDAISLAGHRVAEQIGDILDFTEVDMSDITVTRETYSIGSMVNDLLMQLAFMDNYGLDLVVDLEPQIPSGLRGDAGKLKKILWHLVSNGYKFTKSGGVNLHIGYIHRDYGINLLLEVSDTGVGMSEEELEHIYEKFYQSDSGRSRMSGGLGLGIPIVNGMTLAMGGVLAIESKEGEGTVVRISIPQEVVDEDPCLYVEGRENCVVAGYLGFMTTGHPGIRDYYITMIAHLSQGLGIPFHRVESRQELEKLVEISPITHLFVGTGEYLENEAYIEELSRNMNVALVADIGYTGGAGGGVTILPKPFYGAQIVNFLNHVFDENKLYDEKMTTPGIRALVVDDEPMNLLVAKGIFEAYGMQVTTAAGGAESIELCQHTDYDIIFMDHMMPGMDGVEAMKILRANAAKNKKELCIVALTANAISSAKEMFLSEGFDGFIAKPVEMSELERVLKRVLPKNAIVYQKKENTGNYEWNLEGMGSGTLREITKVSSKAYVNRNPSPPEDEFAALKKQGVDIEKGLGYCQHEIPFYKEVLREYAKDRDRKLADLDKMYEEKDWELYKIKVHAIKSTSKMIGAMALSEEAKELENAAGKKDEAFIVAKHADMREAYEKMIHAIEEACGIEGQTDDDDGMMEFAPASDDGDV